MPRAPQPRLGHPTAPGALIWGPVPAPDPAHVGPRDEAPRCVASRSVITRVGPRYARSRDASRTNIASPFAHEGASPRGSGNIRNAAGGAAGLRELAPASSSSIGRSSGERRGARMTYCGTQ